VEVPTPVIAACRAGDHPATFSWSIQLQAIPACADTVSESSRIRNGSAEHVEVAEGDKNKNPSSSLFYRNWRIAALGKQKVRNV